MSFRRFFSALATVTVAVALLSIVSSDLKAQRGPAGQSGSAQDSGRNQAGQFDYYTLALSWSPTYCAGLRQGGFDPQCHSRDGKRYAFVLHGLWPQNERGWPERCPTRARPYVPQRVIDGMLDIMPSSKLVIHQYRKHGTCSGLNPEEYFNISRRYFDKVRIPPRYVQPNVAFTASPSEIIRDFLSVNPKLKADQLAIACSGRGNQLREVRVCFTREGTFRSCGQNEDARRLCRASRLFVPPVRGGTSNQDGTPSPHGERRI